MNDSGRMGMDKRKYFLLKTLIFLFMFVAALIALFPFYWMFVTAVKPVDEIFAFPPKLWPGEFIWSNFATALSRAPFGISRQTHERSSGINSAFCYFLSF